MPFRKGAPRPANAGRKKGTPNKINAEITDQLADMECNPIIGIATIAQSVENPVGIRLRAYEILMEYVKPKLSRVEWTGKGGRALFPIDAIREFMAAQPGEEEAV